MRRRHRRAAYGLFVASVAAISVGLSTDLRSPPRYDGAGYSVLGWSIRTGQGYREIAHPGSPLHAHFPPGYPAVLASLWTMTGRSVIAAHLLSVVCTVSAVWLAWQWFRRIERPVVANLLALALAVNWTWANNGGGIQSEPLYLLLTILVLVMAKRPGGVAVGLLLGLSVLTRHVGICLVAAVVLDRCLSRQWREAGVIGLVATAMVSPWIYWLATVKGKSQAGLLQGEGLASLIRSQTLFYARRLPDTLAGPFVEVATVFGRSRWVALIATVGAIVFSLITLVGLIRATRNPRKRLAGLVPLLTLPLLLVWPFTEAGRFLIPLVPCLLVGLVEGFGWIGRFVAWGPTVSNSGSRRLILGAGLILLIALPYPLYSHLTNRAGAQRSTHVDFDLACQWIVTHASKPGTVMTRHPGEVFWQTGRKAIASGTDDLEALSRQLDAENVAYLLVDPDRFANAPPTPLAGLAKAFSRRIRRVREGTVEVYEVSRDSGP